MSSISQQKLLDIISFTSKLLRKNFGRGPESCQAFVNHQYLVFYIRGFLSPMESVLLENGNADNIDISRGIVMQSVLAQLKGALELQFEQDVRDFYHDWNYPNNTGTIIVVFERELTALDPNIEQFPESTALKEEVSRISFLVEKVPEQVEAYRISPKLYLVKRVGILVPIEKALIAKGFQNTLVATKDDLEKALLPQGRTIRRDLQPVCS
ncbi:Na-translocating system protein MpsC family protein [Ammoniphilus sp. 3BR4]|uniref:Na-translocating system protein MpsC family protein n=1 Tax=Ammoniphilus sp. 3BR4 TaxID=3158265 RepID=UPI003464FE73